MRIIIDARGLNLKDDSSIFINLLRNIDYSQNEYAIIGKKEELLKYNFPCKIIDNSYSVDSFRYFINYTLSKIINCYDIYFSFSILIPRNINISSYSLLLDSSLLLNIKSHPIKRHKLKRSYRVVDKIFTLSEDCKKQLESYFGINKEIINLDTDLNENNENENISKENNLIKNSYNFNEIWNTIILKFEINKSKVKVRRNFIFNLIYQFLVVLTPLITTPYLSRILGVANIGQFSFAYTITYYFIIFGYLGFSTYAQRAIAETSKNKEEQTRIFWQIVILRLIPVSISLIVLFTLYFIGVFGDYSIFVLILSILVVGCAFDINFYFHGKENYLFVMVVNLIIRLIFLIFVFTFIKSKDDTWLYTLFYGFMVFFCYLSMWLALPSNLVKVKLNGLNFKKHFKQVMLLFLPFAAVSIYAILDKTLIGILMHGEMYQKIGYITVIAKISDVENGYYYQTERIVKALLSIILAFGIVMSSRNSVEYSSNHLGSVKLNIYKSFRFVFALGVPIALGTILVAQSFVPIYFGDGYEKVSILLMIYSPIILIVGVSNVIGVQYLLPLKRDRLYSISVLIGFVINLALNCILIPFIGSIGAVIGTLVSEAIIALIQGIFIRKEISFILVLKLIWKYVLAGLIMLGLGFILYYFVLLNLKIKNIFFLIILIPTGAALYLLILLILKDRYLFELLDILKEKLKSILVFIKTSFIKDESIISSISVYNNKEVNIKNKKIINNRIKKDGN